MSIFLSLSSNFESLVIGIIGFVLMMSFIVFIHEFGHFYVARLCGVKVLDFSIGFGKKLFSKQDKHGTIWSLSMIPMGGYVKFFGDKSVASQEDMEALNDLGETEKQKSFYFKSIPQKMAIILAGPLANIILCFILLFSMGFFLGIMKQKPIIQDVIPQSAASLNGLKSGDRFVRVNGRDVSDAQQVRQEIVVSFGEKIDFTILRDNNLVSLSFLPDMVSQVKDQEKIPIIGITFSKMPENITMSRYDFLNSMTQAYQNTFFAARITLSFFKQLFTGKAPINSLSGPVRIGDAAGSALRTGAWSFLFLMAMISMSVGMVNLLPIPMLDGGHFVFYIFEAIGLKAHERLREFAFKMGFVLLMMVMAFTVINDIVTIGGR
jgi:regulator of sigma E protease